MKSILFFITTCLISLVSFGQLEKIIVEKYYVSDASDATDTTGGKLDVGSITYRIYVDMKKGSKLKRIYGDNNHPIQFSSTANFFNHKTDGQTFAKDFVKGRYGEGLVALDSWLTLGQTTKKQGTKTYFGTLKSMDDDGTFIGGQNNDGGSAGIANGLLLNSSSDLGIPLTIADGMDTMTQLPASWTDFGIKDFTTGEDSTIFGSLRSSNSFKSLSFSLGNSGVSGVNADSNMVLVAQLTTVGELSFKINLEIEELVNGVPTLNKYVSSDSIIEVGEIFSPLLRYPAECGCQDANYLEYKPSYSCSRATDCKTPIVYGCTDTMACNFDPKANFMIHNLCCYPGACSDRDIAEVCPSLKGEAFEFEIFPNPASSDIFVKGIVGNTSTVQFVLYDAYGVEVYQQILPVSDRKFSEQINITTLVNGLYIARIISNETATSQLFMKN